jgi:predicted TIM-barrel fold metal-dependent hydrolase
MHFISADNHLDLLWMPRDLWQQRLPAKLREAGPKVVETERGSFWQYEGELHGTAADGSSNAAMLNILRERGFEAPDGSLPPSDPELLIDYMDQCGMLAAITFGGVAWKTMKDVELQRAVYEAYNDFAVGVGKATNGRVIILPGVFPRSPEDCPAQIESLARRGVKAVEFPYWDVRTPLFEEEWEPTWRAAAEAGVVICGHLSIPGGPANAAPRRRGARSAWASAVPMTVSNAIGQLIFAGVFERYPSLQFCFAETRIGWAPFFADWMDRQIRIGREDDPRQAATDGPRDRIQLSLLPSEYFRRNVTLTFEEDTWGVHLLDEPASCLADVALWGGDFPHPQGVWGPSVDSQLDDVFSGVSEATKRRVLFEHAAELFDIQVPARA